MPHHAVFSPQRQHGHPGMQLLVVSLVNCEGAVPQDLVLAASWGISTVWCMCVCVLWDVWWYKKQQRK